MKVLEGEHDQGKAEIVSVYVRRKNDDNINVMVVYFPPEQRHGQHMSMKRS